MLLNRFLTILGVLLALLLFVIPAEAAKGAKKKKGNKPVAGLVEDVKKDSLKIKTRAKKKTGSPGETKEFTLNDSTKFEKVSGKKKERTTSPATASDLKAGSRVRISANGTTADKVQILEGKKKKK